MLIDRTSTEPSPRTQSGGTSVGRGLARRCELKGMFGGRLPSDRKGREGAGPTSTQRRVDISPTLSRRRCDGGAQSVRMQGGKLQGEKKRDGRNNDGKTQAGEKQDKRIRHGRAQDGGAQDPSLRGIPPRYVALVVLTRTGLELALQVQQGLNAETHIYASQRAFQTRSLEVGANAITSFDSIGLLLAQLWETHDQMVLFFALGAAIRLIAPLLKDKHSDPGVVVIDDASKFAISVVSGHSGGANGLTRQCAHILGAVPVVTTASDAHNTLAVDLLSCKMGWQIEDTSQVTAVSAAMVNGEPVAILQETGQSGWWDSACPWPGNLVRVNALHEVTTATFAALLVISDRLVEGFPLGLPTIVYRPSSLVLGIGCRRGVSFTALDAFIKTTLEAHHLAFQSIAVLASVDLKADEVALQRLAEHYSWRFETHTVGALKAVTAIATPSEHVQLLIGTPSVSEAAAILSSCNGQLVVCKCKGEGMTLAVARRLYSDPESGDASVVHERRA